jgi:hypothetical protein
MEPVVKGEFTISVVLGQISLSDGDHTLLLSPGEAEIAQGLLETVRRVQTWKVLPRKIDSSPLEVHFLSGEENDCALVKPKATEKKRCEFKFSNSDDFVSALKMGLEMYYDHTKFQGNDKGLYKKLGAPEPLIEG